MIDDMITLPYNKTMTILAVNHALVQSAKLGRFEVMSERTIKDNAYKSQTLAKIRKIPLSQKRLAMLRGALFSIKSDIILHFNLLDTPEFFRENPEQAQNTLP